MASRKSNAGGLPAQSEAQFTALVLELAAMLGWRSAHFRPGLNRRGKWSTPMQGDVGFPDLLLLRAGRQVVAELKRSDKEKPTPEQTAWLEAFKAVGAEVHVWRPADWQTIVETLTA